MSRNRNMCLLLTGVLLASTLSGCGMSFGGPASTTILDPNHPVTLTIWHYYNGAQQTAFDELVSEFNATEGKEKGIYVEGYSKGSVSDLEQAISDALSEKVGADPLPDIFSTYADTAYAVQKAGKLTDLKQYIDKQDLDLYVDSYIEEGLLTGDGSLYLFPVAKSTEIMMINETDWLPFANATGSTYQELETIEGVVEVAKRYYEWTDAKTPDIPNDGKAFYGRDSMSNYFIINMKQMGIDLFDVQEGEVTIRAEKDAVRRLWDNYYVPYVNGYFASMGKFRSDDVKTGDILAYTGSSSSSMYFPDAVLTDDESRTIDFAVLPVPKMEGGANVNVQQGANMVVTKSDIQHEFASCEFLRWFSAKDNNLRFVCESAYLPVTKEANSVAALDETIQTHNLEVNKKAYSCLVDILEDFDDTTFYTTKVFHNGYPTRRVLDYNLSDKASADKLEIDEAIASGENREEVIARYTTDENFEAWYESFCKALEEKAYE